MLANRTRILGFVCCSALAVIWARACYLGMALGPFYRVTLRDTALRVRPIPAPRGRILAADGSELAVDRCDADLAVHYRYLERPLDDGWLTTQALARLSRRQARDPARVEAAKQDVRGEVAAMWRALAELTGTDEAELARRGAAIQRRVERIAASVNRRRRERRTRQTAADESTAAPGGESPAPGDRPSAWQRVAAWFSPPPAALPPRLPAISVVEQSRSYTLVEELPPEVVLRFTEHPERYPGVRLEQRIRRVYPERDLAAAVLGYVQPADDSAAGDASPLQTSGIGRAGVEGFYEDQLRGRPGEVREQVAAPGGAPRVLSGRPPRAGWDVVLTLDLRLQRFAEQLLDGVCAAGTESSPAPASGAVFVLDVASGAVLVAATEPRCDPNAAARPASPEGLELAARPDAPLFSRIHQMCLPPGSCFKPVTAVAALHVGVDPAEPYSCRGYLHEPDKFRCLIYRHAGVGHGSVIMTDALARSCNVYFFQLAERIGWEPIARWGAAFGFGQRSGIDLAGEEPGVLFDLDTPTPGRRRSVSPGESLSLAIGQGTLSATPVQVAVMMAAIANGGLRVVPHVRRDAAQPPRFVDGLVPPANRSLAVVRTGLEQVVADPHGTGHEHVFLPEIEIAGKTGTAQSGSSRGDHAWFAGYVPAKNPRFTIVVVLEHAGSGGHAAGPLARELVRHLLELGYFPAAQARAESSAPR